MDFEDGVGLRAEEISAILKRRFPNLTVAEVIGLIFKIEAIYKPYFRVIQGDLNDE